MLERHVDKQADRLDERRQNPQNALGRDWIDATRRIGVEIESDRVGAESSRATGVGFSGDATDFDAQRSHTGKLT